MSCGLYSRGRLMTLCMRWLRWRSFGHSVGACLTLKRRYVQHVRYKPYGVALDLIHLIVQEHGGHVQRLREVASLQHSHCQGAVCMQHNAFASRSLEHAQNQSAMPVHDPLLCMLTLAVEGRCGHNQQLASCGNILFRGSGPCHYKLHFRRPI